MVSAIIKIPDLIRIALSPKQVNFETLQLALQAMLYQLDLMEMKLQFKGDDSTKIQQTIKESKDPAVKGINITLIEDVGEEGEEEEDKKAEESIQEEEFYAQEAKDSMETVNRRSTLSEMGEEIIQIEFGKVIEPVKRNLPAVTPISFTRLDRKVKGIQAQIDTLTLNFLPSDEAILEATRNGEAEPIRDLLQGLNITKRMTGAEESLDKLASILDTMAREYANLKTIIDKLEDELGDNILHTMKDIKDAAEYSRKLRPRTLLYPRSSGRRRRRTKCSQIEKLMEEEEEEKPKKTTTKRASGINSRFSMLPTPKIFIPEQVRKEQTPSITGNLPPPQEDSDPALEDGQQPAKDYCDDIKIDESKKSKKNKGGIPAEYQKAIKRLLKDHGHVLKNMEFLNAEMNTISDFLDAIMTKLQTDPIPGSFLDKVTELNRRQTKKKTVEIHGEDDEMPLPVDERMECLEIQFSDLTDKVQRQLAAFCGRTNSISVRINDIETNISTLFKNMSIVINYTEKQDEKPINKILEVMAVTLKLVIRLEKEFNQMNNELKTELLLSRQEDKVVEECLQQLEHMKKTKADRFEIDEFLASKADCEMLRSKVSLEEFELVCNDFARGIEDTLNKVSIQEDILKMILNEVHATLGRKCEQEDLDNMRDELLNKMNSLQTETVADSKNGRIAAGGKQKLTPMNCVSCDREVVMKTSDDIPPIPAIGELPPSHSIKPYISFQLDQLRKLILKNPSERTIFVFEEAMRRYRVKPLDPEQNEIYVPGVNNRYCGGKHTTAKPKKLDCKKFRKGEIVNADPSDIDFHKI